MLYIFSKDEKLVAILKPDFGRTTIKTGVSQAFLHTEYPAAFDRAEVEGCPYFDAVHTEKLTGENIFTFSVPANHQDAQYVTEGNLVAFKDLDGNWQLFEIKRVTDTHDDDLIRTAFCEHVFYELIDDFIEDKRPYNTTAAYALQQALEGTRWQAGNVDDLGLNSVNFYYESVLSALQKVANTWGGELQFRIAVVGNTIAARYVDLLSRRGAETGKQFVYSKDIKSIEREVDLTQVVTALYGRGKGEQIEEGYGRRITFEDVEWSVTNGDPADKPLGQKWVGDPEALARWGRPGGRHRFGVFEDSEEEDPAVLLQKTWEELQRRKNPRITYKLDVADLERLTGYEHEKVRLGDTVRIIDRAFSPELLVEARVIEINRDLLQPENTKITLGNFAPSIVDETIKQEQIRQTVSDRQGVWDRANQFNPDGTLDTEWLNGIIDTLRNEVRAGRGTVTVTDNNGILIVDDPDNPTKALRLLGGMFAIANSKDPVTGEWNWRTFGTGDGFIADLITAGKLKGGKVTFDLTNGTLLIGNNTEDYNLYYDGNNLSIKLNNKKTIETALTELETGLQDYTNQKTQEAIDNIQIGGRNYICQFTNPKWKIHRNAEVIDSVTLKHSGTTGQGPKNRSTLEIKLDEPGSYTLSGFIKGGPDLAIVLRPVGAGVQHTWYFNIEGDYKYITKTFRIQEPVIYTLELGGKDEPTEGLYFKKLKLEKGNKATDWTPAPEDVEADIQNAEDNAKSYTDDVATRIEEKTAQLTASVDGITSEVSSIITEIGQVREYAESLVQQSADQLQVSITEQLDDLEDELVTRFQSEIQATADELTLKFTEYQESLSEIGADINNLKTTFRFSLDGFEIGKSDSPLKMFLTNEKLSFLDAGTEIAYISSQKMFITEAEILNSIKVGNHIMERYNDEITLIRWVG